jgi:hypothetical protein
MTDLKLQDLKMQIGEQKKLLASPVRDAQLA